MPVPVTVLGTPSSHGGHMISASGFPTINGVPTCLDGDLHACPMGGTHPHGVTSVRSISRLTTVNGRKIIIEGSVAGCGAVILVSQTLVTSD